MPSPGGAVRPQRGASAATSTAPITSSSEAWARSRPFLAPVDLDLCPLDAIGDEQLDRVRRVRDELVRILVRLEIPEHPVGQRTRVTPLRPPDADAQTEEILRAELLRDRPKAVVAGEPAARLQLEATEVEVALVVDDEHFIRLHLEERSCRADRAPGLVHVRLR